MALTKEESAAWDAAMSDMLKNTDKHKAAFIKKQKKESPEVTDEQLENIWAQAVNQLL